MVSMAISGPQPALNRLGPTEVVATVDAAGRGPGSHSLPVAAQVPDGVRVDRITPESVTVSLAPRPSG